MKQLNAADLVTVTGDFATPFRLTLSAAGESETWECEAILRVLAGRRIVVRARTLAAQGEYLLEEDAPERILKLFIGREHRRYFERERRGLAWLAAAGLPVPEISREIHTPGLSGLIIEYLPGADVVPPEDQTAVEGVAVLLGRMHEAGLWQADLHLKNFVLCDEALFAIDGDGVKRRANPLPMARGLEDLALLAAQRPPREDGRAAGLVAAYGGARKGLEAPAAAEFRAKLDSARRGRMTRYLKKSFRDCSEFSVTRDEDFRYFAVRGQGERVLAALKADGRLSPGEEFLSVEAVKQGNSATLVRTDATIPVIIKRYNIKNLQQGVRRMLRPLPRYRRAWMMGQLLRFLDLPTARPMALIEERRGLLPGVAYLVMEDLGSTDLATEVAQSGLDTSRCEEVGRLFFELERAGLTHGDTKATNFLIHDGRVQLIDLDAMRLGRRGFARDLDRFLENWKEAERGAFETAFRVAGLL